MTMLLLALLGAFFAWSGGAFHGRWHWQAGDKGDARFGTVLSMAGLLCIALAVWP